jgi:L-cystine uptake protein TcyP (sodium:dicarboxylate symporter family)
MSVNQAYNYCRAEYPESVMKRIKFHVFFGLSFLGISSEDNEKKWSKIKSYLLVAYNLVVIFVMMSLQIYITPGIFEEQQKSGTKKVMK